MNERERIKERLSYFSKLYNYVQIFGPMSENNQLEKKVSCKLDEDCVMNNACENCVAIRSMIENKTISKYETHDEKGICITATPVIENGKTYIVEMFRELNQDDLMYMGVVKSDIVNQIESLNHELMYDSLTGVYNRRFLEEKFTFIVLDALRKKEIISVAMADIDYFKEVNDTYGHQAGDRVLQVFAKLFQQEFKSLGSLIIRYGGEEFLVYMPGVDSEQAPNIVETVREHVESNPIFYEDQAIHITASFGISTVCMMEEAEESCTDRLIKHVDTNLYQAKNKGRNCVVASVCSKR